jgi:hypothetical protein
VLPTPGELFRPAQIKNSTAGEKFRVFSKNLLIKAKIIGVFFSQRFIMQNGREK